MFKKLLIISLCSLIIPAQAVTLAVYDSLSDVGAPYPYSYKSKTGQLLECIGTCHTGNQRHSQYATIDKQWKLFIKATANKPITIIETTHPGSYSTAQTALQAANDCGYANWLSSHHQVPVVGAELSHEQIVRQLVAEFGKEQGYYFAFAQAMDFATRIQAFSESAVLARVHSWTGDSSITFEQLKTIHKNFTGFNFSPNATFFFNLMNIAHHTSFLRSYLHTFSIPKSTLNKFYPILRRSHQIRDQHLLSTITDQWKQGKNIFLVYGYMHAAALKKSLQQLVKNTC